MHLVGIAYIFLLLYEHHRAAGIQGQGRAGGPISYLVMIQRATAFMVWGFATGGPSQSGPGDK